MDEQTALNQETAAMMARTAYMSQENQGINSLLSDLLDTQRDIKDVEMRLRGQDYDEKGEIIQVVEPLMNDEGIYHVITQLTGLVSKVVYMSDLEEEQIRIMVYETLADLNSQLTINKLKWGLKTPLVHSTIIDVVLNKSMAGGFSALNNGMKKLVRGVSVETTINTQGQGIKSGKGGLGSILSLGRK